jgi:Mn-dependent DtxR family transcriptional regulator
MQVRQSAEDYLETILFLFKKTGAVRSKDIVMEMGLSKPSVSVAMKKLRELGMIEMDEDSYIRLTPKGLEVATKVHDRHMTLFNWLVSNGVDAAIAEKDACRMEHVISNETFEMIKRQAEKQKA